MAKRLARGSPFVSPSLGTNLTRQHGNPFMVATSNDTMRVSFEMQLLAAGACKHHELEGRKAEKGVGFEAQSGNRTFPTRRRSPMVCPSSKISSQMSRATRGLLRVNPSWLGEAFAGEHLRSASPCPLRFLLGIICTLDYQQDHPH